PVESPLYCSDRALAFRDRIGPFNHGGPPMTRVGRLVVLGFLFVLPSAALAQLSTGQITGRVTDQSGAVLPGVTVTATQTDTGQARTVVTDASGTYVVPNLPTGPYRLEAMLQGFRSYVQTGIVLQVAG